MPSSPGYKRDYKQERLTESPERRKQRALRNAARRKLMEEGLVRKGDGKDVGHKRALSKGGKNRRENLEVQSASRNRSFRRDSHGRMVSERSRRESRR